METDVKETGFVAYQHEVKAILEGKKSQTRRVIKPQPELTICDELYKQNMAMMPDLCPYGQVGDRLYVREGWCPSLRGTTEHEGFKRILVYREGRDEIDVPPQYNEWYDRVELSGYSWRPSIHMPRWASRITLEITGIKVERIQDIPENDCYAEGVEQPHKRYLGVGSATMLLFQYLWDGINTKRGYGWDVNPWDWALTFKVVK